MIGLVDTVFNASAICFAENRAVKTWKSAVALPLLHPGGILQVLPTSPLFCDRLPCSLCGLALYEN